MFSLNHKFNEQVSTQHRQEIALQIHDARLARELEAAQDKQRTLRSVLLHLLINVGKLPCTT